MFEHEKFDVYAYENLPTDTDCYLISEEYLREYETAFLSFFSGGPSPNVGYVGFAAVRRINSASMELSWYSNTSTRFHEVSISLPKDQFVTCVGSWQCDEKPHIFVKTAWLEELYVRLYSVFCLVDAIDFEAAFRSGRITRERLLLLRAAIDGLASQYPEVLFISFADSVILKSNWSVGHFRSSVRYTYKPEVFLHIINSIQKIYSETLGLSVYAVVTQGSNEYYDDPLLHESPSGKHICLNSLGLPFAQLFSIDAAVKKGRHPFADLYMDAKFYRSLRGKHSYRFPTKF